MKKLGKRILALAMTLLMLASSLPMAAFASLVDNDPAYNAEILGALRDLAGSEDEALRYDVTVYKVEAWAAKSGSSDTV